MADVEQPLPLVPVPATTIQVHLYPLMDPISWRQPTNAALPGPKPRHLSLWLWGGLNAHVYRMRQEVTWMMFPSRVLQLAFCGLCGYLIGKEEEDDTFWAVFFYTLSTLCFFISTWIFGFLAASIRFEHMINKLGGVVEQQGWELTVRRNRLFFMDFCLALRRIPHATVQNVPVDIDQYPIRYQLPYTSFLFGDGWKHPWTPDPWTMGGLLYLFEADYQPLLAQKLKKIPYTSHGVVSLVCFMLVHVPFYKRILAWTKEKDWVFGETVSMIVATYFLFSGSVMLLVHCFCSLRRWKPFVWERIVSHMNEELDRRRSGLVVELQRDRTIVVRRRD